jgi:hypothetical protein
MAAPPIFWMSARKRGCASELTKPCPMRSCCPQRTSRSGDANGQGRETPDLKPRRTVPAFSLRPLDHKRPIQRPARAPCLVDAMRRRGCKPRRRFVCDRRGDGSYRSLTGGSLLSHVGRCEHSHRPPTSCVAAQAPRISLELFPASPERNVHGLARSAAGGSGYSSKRV